MDKAEKLKQATEQTIAYMDIIRMFNNLNHDLRGEYYTFSEKLTNAKSETVPGFVCKGYAASAGLGKILESIGIKFTTFIKSGSGFNENSEIRIHKKYINKMLDLAKRFGPLQSNVFHTPNIINENNQAR